MYRFDSVIPEGKTAGLYFMVRVVAGLKVLSEGLNL